MGKHPTTTRNRGLNLFSMKLKNKLLLANWVWRYINEKIALWRKFIDAKYGNSSQTIEPGTFSLVTAKRPWKAILKNQNLIFDSFSYKIGNWHNISFWNDSWLLEDSLARKFPLLFELSPKNGSAVKDISSEES